mmetsp:Transcript_6634/g.15197  ORF Transcript_6634/g.15197 Transcript_6634/m.15197 type:complete len:570 (-) Transcript_6634:200-1909(-)
MSMADLTENRRRQQELRRQEEELISSGAASHEDQFVKKIVAARRALRGEEKRLIREQASGHERSIPEERLHRLNGSRERMEQDSDDSNFYDEISEGEINDDSGEEDILHGGRDERSESNMSHRPPAEDRSITPNAAIHGRIRKLNAGASSPSQIVFVDRPPDHETAGGPKRPSDQISSPTEQQPSKDHPNESNMPGTSKKSLKLTEHKVLSEKQEKLLKDAITSASPDADGNYSKGKQAVHKGDLKSAEIFFQQALKTEPTHIKALGAYARLLHDQGDFRNAQIMYESALRQAKRSVLSPDALASAVETLSNLAKLLRDVIRDSSRAERMYRRALQIDKRHVDSLCGYAELLYASRQDAKKAKKLLKIALEIEPKHADSLVARAWIWQTSGYDKKTVEREYQDLLKMYPNHAGALCNYALYMHSVRGDLQLAEQLYKRALEADPRNLNSLTNCASLWQMQGRYAEAESYYMTALEYYPDQVDVLHNYGMLLHTKIGNHEKAEALYRRALQLDPEQLDTLLAYAHFLREVRKDHSNANQLLRRAATLQASRTNAASPPSQQSVPLTYIRA